MSMTAQCLIVNCNRRAPADEAFCSAHRDVSPKLKGYAEKPYAYCCNSDTAICDCVQPDHGTAYFRALAEKQL